MKIDNKNVKQRSHYLQMPLGELVSFAGGIKKKFVKDTFELCNIINAKSGLCGEDCKFCAQSSKYQTDVRIYPLKTKKQIVSAALKAKEIGAEKFGIVTSGSRLSPKELNEIVEAVSAIKEKVSISICASLGKLKKSELSLLKEAGLSRYHHNIETSRRFYPEVVSSGSFDERINTIKFAKEVGLEVCSGVIIGMGEDWDDRFDIALTLKELDVESVPINLLVPIKGTPFEKIEPLSCADAIRTICIFRIILKDKIIKIAAGRESILKDFQAMGFIAGANGMLIGGYLTIKGRDVKDDIKLVEEIKNL